MSKKPKYSVTFDFEGDEVGKPQKSEWNFDTKKEAKLFLTELANDGVIATLQRIKKKKKK
jgi:hypothetical protein